MNILVVDDEPSYRMLLEHFLREEGWSVFTAPNGEEGMNELRKTKMDFIISDVYMPVMDGLRFHKSVLAVPELAQIPFLFVSGYDDDQTLEAVRASKSTGFMKKSKPVEELKAWITYLTTPTEHRRGLPPGTEKKQDPSNRMVRREDRYRR
jgi:CheY-like chemotaxis protein